MSRIDDHVIREALATVDEPETGRDLVSLGLVRGVAVVPEALRVTVACPATDETLRDRLRREAEQAVAGIADRRVEIEVRGLTEEEAAALRATLQPTRPSTQEQALGSGRVIAVASGKGGVGKSSVSANLAICLARRGQRVALIDADVYGFSIPRIMGIRRAPTIVDNLVLPPRAHGVAAVSVALFADEHSPIIWRGPMLHKMLSQFVTDVFWDEPDVCIIDMPPGTGDVSMTVAELLPAAEVVVVTTPQPAAQRVAQRAAYMSQRVKLTVAGVIENMSWFTGDDGQRYELFGAGGGALLAEELGVPMLGQIPFVPSLRVGGDEGRPVVVAEPEGEVATALERVADALPRRRRIPLPLLQP